MKPVDIIILAVIAAVLIGSIFFIRRSRKKGRKCIGCPHSKECGGHCGHT